jgi:cell division protein FtsI (penicillin-binding protein 3)
VGETGPVAARRSQFVLLIMGLLGIGLIASLWLSTTAAADSYRLDSARQATRDLSERSESLRADIASMQAAPSLARAAQEMGMVQVSDVARLVVTPDGSIRVVGTPKAAAGAPRPAPVLAAPAPQPGQQPAGQPGQQAQQAPGQQEPGLQAAGPTQQVPTQQAPSQQEPSQQVPAQQAPTQRTSIQPQRLAAPAGLAH